jgi:hypothetical protein
MQGVAGVGAAREGSAGSGFVGDGLGVVEDVSLVICVLML